MENASKALIFAGSVLISIVIVSMLMLVSNSLTSYQQTSVQNQREADIYSFNQQYLGYKRAGVRGNELISLVSKAIDYNYRESSLVETTEQFEPITIVFNLGDADLTKDGTPRIFTLGNQDYEFTKSSYSESLRHNTLDKINELTSTPIPMERSNNDELKKKLTSEGKQFYFTEASLDRLVTAYDKIFLDKNLKEFTNSITDILKGLKTKSNMEAVDVFNNFNSAYGMKFFEIKDMSKVNNSIVNKFGSMWLNLNSEDIKDSVIKYYEYVQFKRAIFDCDEESVRYSNTGRIVYMKFNFTGKYN